MAPAFGVQSHRLMLPINRPDGRRLISISRFSIAKNWPNAPPDFLQRRLRSPKNNLHIKLFMSFILRCILFHLKRLNAFSDDVQLPDLTLSNNMVGIFGVLSARFTMHYIECMLSERFWFHSTDLWCRFSTVQSVAILFCVVYTPSNLDRFYRFTWFLRWLLASLVARIDYRPDCV